MALPIEQFLTTKISEYDSSFDLREGTAFTDLFIKPLEIIMQPFLDELYQVELNQSILSILESTDPNTFDEDVVDALMSNVFVARKPGDIVGGTVRAYFNTPIALDVFQGDARFLDKNGNGFINTADISITTKNMGLQASGDYYFVDVPVQAETQGALVVEAGDIVDWENAPVGLVQVSNLSDFSTGADRETNVELIKRGKNSISVRDLVTGKGIYATLFDNFNTIEELQVIGFGDAEMMRDILYNCHIGGRTDVYLKTPAVKTSTFDVKAILTDTTRQKHYRSNKRLTGVDEVGTGVISIDRTDMIPVIKQIADYTYGTYTSTVDLAGGIDLTTNYNTRIEVMTGTGVVANQVGIQGATPSNTTRAEIIAAINAAFGFTLAVAKDIGSARYIKFTCPVIGPSGYVKFTAPTTADATFEVFGLNQAVYPHIFFGTAPTIYVEDVDYTVDDANATFTRISGGSITDGQLVEVQFDYNPVSIDIGKPVRNTDGTYTFRPGRETKTIVSLPVLAVKSIEILDPVSGEGTGQFLDGTGGFGQGGFGRGEFGIGSGAEYRIVVINPHTHFSMLDESFVEIIPNYIGLDLRVTFMYAPEIEAIQNFCQNALQRLLEELQTPVLR